MVGAKGGSQLKWWQASGKEGWSRSTAVYFESWAVLLLTTADIVLLPLLLFLLLTAYRLTRFIAFFRGVIKMPITWKQRDKKGKLCVAESGTNPPTVATAPAIEEESKATRIRSGCVKEGNNDDNRHTGQDNGIGGFDNSPCVPGHTGDRGTFGIPAAAEAKKRPVCSLSPIHSQSPVMSPAHEHGDELTNEYDCLVKPVLRIQMHVEIIAGAVLRVHDLCFMLPAALLIFFLGGPSSWSVLRYCLFASHQHSWTLIRQGKREEVCAIQQPNYGRICVYTTTKNGQEQQQEANIHIIQNLKTRTRARLPIELFPTTDWRGCLWTQALLVLLQFPFHLLTAVILLTIVRAHSLITALDWQGLTGSSSPSFVSVERTNIITSMNIDNAPPSLFRRKYTKYRNSVNTQRMTAHIEYSAPAITFVNAFCWQAKKRVLLEFLFLLLDAVCLMPATLLLVTIYRAPAWLTELWTSANRKPLNPGPPIWPLLAQRQDEEGEEEEEEEGEEKGGVMSLFYIICHMIYGWALHGVSCVRA